MVPRPVRRKARPLRRRLQPPSRLRALLRPLVLVPVLLLALGGAAFAVFAGEGDESESTVACARTHEAAGAEKGGEKGKLRGEALLERLSRCGRKHPELAGDLTRVATALSQRFGQSDPDGYARATAARARIAKATPAPGGAGRWQAVGNGPLVSDDPAYPGTFGEGFAKLAGRITDYVSDPAHHRIIASVAYGGVWESTDGGAHWRSIGESLPTQIVGSVGYTSADGGTLIALTGDNAFGGYTYGGVGAYRSTNGGKSWQKVRGVPNGAQGFKVAVDPNDARKVYLATGLGLFRSTDAGVSFANVNLPTGACRAAAPSNKKCFLANVVTDVAVQGKDNFGHQGGTVLAAVGWRDGAFKAPDGTVEAPANGLYRSDTGAPNTFADIDEGPAGFAPQPNVGRVELGAAVGSDQNHGYVYALVQDAVLFSRGTLEGLDTGGTDGDPLGAGVNPLTTATYLNGVYVSADFGKTWTQVANRQQFQNPASGSTLAQLQGLGFGPGIQSWYDEWIKPDPTRQLGGVPTRVELGLEEVYENRITNLPVNGRNDFRTTGPYNANGGACLLVLASDACSAKQGATPGNTTTHPDQHAGLWVPDGKGGVSLFAGNDGGNYVQRLGKGQETTTSGFGPGAQDGFNTLLPYGLDVANDGTVFAGLQDNGELRIDPKTGKQNMVFGGDGVFTQVNPKNAKVVYEETPEAGISVSQDGGKTFQNLSPFIDNPSFYAPLVMDPLNADHIVTGGRQVTERTTGPRDITDPTGSNTEDVADYKAGDPKWVRVFDLGTRKHPGKAPASDPNSGAPVIEKGDSQNQVSAEGVRGAAVYAAFCGSCDPVRDHVLFHSGIATNVGGKGAPKSNSSSGWHIAAARGLPQRLISSVAVDPQNVRTVYVTLGSSSLRPYVPAGGAGADGLSARAGVVYKSTDAGQTFHDISGNLPNVAGTWVLLHGRQLVVGTGVGVFASRTGTSSRSTKALRYGALGHGLPPAPVFSMTLKHDDSRYLYVASYGRGIYRYKFTRVGKCRDRIRPVSRFAKRGVRVTRRGVSARGTSSDKTNCRGKKGRVKRVYVSIGKESANGKMCRFLLNNGKFSRVRPCGRGNYLPAKGTRHWTFSRKVRLGGGVRVDVRAHDIARNRERAGGARNVRRVRLR